MASRRFYLFHYQGCDCCSDVGLTRNHLDAEERVERETKEKIARQHAIKQLRLESELHKLRLDIESTRSNVRRTSCAEDPKKTSSNYRISIKRAEEHVRETSPAVLMAESAIPVTTPIKVENGIDDSWVVHIKGEQGILNAAIDTGVQIPVVIADVVEGQSVNNKGTIQFTSAFWEHEIGELKGSSMEINDLRHGVVHSSKNLVNDMLICSSDYEGLIENSQLIRNPAILREPSKEEGITNSTDSKSVCSQEVVTDLRPETYTQSLSNAPNENLIVVESNASNVQTNGQGIKESKRKVALFFPADSLDSVNNFILSGSVAECWKSNVITFLNDSHKHVNIQFQNLELLQFCLISR
ncbi:hypothetical protein TNCV_4434171 [Trichonephila clavipes]|nr:hypothetical protein TNCV_4434171 [Trichonephila clavipes]